MQIQSTDPESREGERFGKRHKLSPSPYADPSHDTGPSPDDNSGPNDPKYPSHSIDWASIMDTMSTQNQAVMQSVAKIATDIVVTREAVTTLQQLVEPSARRSSQPSTSHGTEGAATRGAKGLEEASRKEAVKLFRHYPCLYIKITEEGLSLEDGKVFKVSLSVMFLLCGRSDCNSRMSCVDIFFTF